MINELKNQQIVSRACVQHLRTSRHLRISTESGIVYLFDTDDKLSHDIALAVQDYFRRTGKDFRRMER